MWGNNESLDVRGNGRMKGQKGVGQGTYFAKFVGGRWVLGVGRVKPGRLADVGWCDRRRNRKALLSNFARNLKFSDTFTSEVAPWIRGVPSVFFLVHCFDCCHRFAMSFLPFALGEGLFFRV